MQKDLNVVLEMHFLTRPQKGHRLLGPEWRAYDAVTLVLCHQCCRSHFHIDTVAIFCMQPSRLVRVNRLAKGTSGVLEL